MSNGRGNGDGVGACGQLACQEAQSRFVSIGVGSWLRQGFFGR